MKRAIQISAVAALLGGFTVLLTAGAKANGFEKIAVRNVFALRAPSSPTITTPPAPKLSQPKLTVTGITDLGGIPKILLESSEPGKPPKRAILSEGDSLGEIRILHIDVSTGRVKILMDGVETTLKLGSERTSAASDRGLLRWFTSSFFSNGRRIVWC